MGKAIAYVRVSTEEQAQEGVSLEAQEARIRSYCQMQGLELLEVVSDQGVSASKPMSKRAGGARVLAAVKAGEADAVVALKLDRLFRNARDCLAVTEGWQKRGAGLHLLDMGGQAVDTSSAMGQFFLLMMAGVAQMERTLIAERTSAALAHKRAKGEKTGGDAPLGFKADRSGDVARLEADQGESGAVERMRELAAKGVTVRRIAAQLESEGFKPRGKRWHPTTVHRTLKRLKRAA